MNTDMTEHDVNSIAERVEEAILARISRWLLIYALPAVIANGVMITGIIWWAAVADTRLSEHQRVLNDKLIAASELAVLRSQVEGNTQNVSQAMRDIREALNRIEDRQYRDRRANGRVQDGVVQ